MYRKPLIDTVALIDDDDIHLELYKRVIKRSGLVNSLLTFRLAEEALAHFTSQGPQHVNVVFLDINMPRMDGFEFLDEVTRSNGDSFVDAVFVMLTTSLNPKDRQRATQYKVVKDFLNKPLTIADIERVARLL